MGTLGVGCATDLDLEHLTQRSGEVSGVARGTPLVACETSVSSPL